MNETIELIHKHGSVRSYKPDPVPPDLLEAIVVAGQRASTSSNMQMWSAIVVQDETKRHALAKLCGDQKHIYQAPVFIAWVADLSRLNRVAQHQGYEQRADYTENFLLAAVDAAIAMQNGSLAAESLGLGFCYIGAIRNHPQEVIDLLELPPLTFPISGMTLGYPTEPPRIRPRLSPDAILHWERYNPDDETHLRAYDKEMIATGIYRGRQVAVERNGEMVEIDYGWMEHSARRNTTPKRPHLRDVLEKQGFLLK